MPTERNALCRCGSGKKHKKCCASGAALMPDNISLNRRIAYIGQVGRGRERFCLEYISTKRAVTQSIEHGLTRDAAAAEKIITCSKGCGECCSTYYIAASLQECEAIVYWLYQHEEALKRFLRTFDTWQAKIADAAKCLNAINLLYGKIILSQATEAEKQAFRSNMNDYESRHITCPFLENGACTIYEVRPYVCACVVSLSPPEWCSLSHPDRKRMEFLKIELPLAKDMPYFIQPKPGILFSAMPMLVYDILSKGYSALADIPGLEILQQLAMNDPEVLAMLREP